MPATSGRTRLLTKPEAAADLGVSDSTLRRHIAAGEISVVRIGRTVRIDPVELDRFVAEGPRSAAPEPDPRREHILALVARAPRLTADQASRISDVLRASS
ncbi:helix-turn-helix domain-containing protein [Gordonia sp. HS-NH1]|uniref:helix-turn-helix domain-containing protein n=1 Tax=Gordonia sp. HS-NH1 TaxID=1435068 RepID=UPI0006E43FBB|nr:helix-turn-helix domain-containing protein [Gordonia sp. HS-NH1]